VKGKEAYQETLKKYAREFVEMAKVGAENEKAA